MEKTMKQFMTLKIIQLLFLTSVIGACEDFVDISLTNAKITSSAVFKDDNTATSAIIGIYHDMDRSVIVSGDRSSFSRMAGLSSDELHDYKGINGITQFEENVLNPGIAGLNGLWNSFYKTIYQANAVIEGIENTKSLSAKIKDQLMGEAKFIRAFAHFQLTNMFGDVPLITTTDYRKNSIASRDLVTEVYGQIADDLVVAQSLLSDSYIAADRLRPNKATATALLAKVYLYLLEWENAEIQSSQVIGNALYEISNDLTTVFLKNSNEAIWQICPAGVLNNTDEALYYVITGLPTYLVLSDQLVNSFETGDNRFLSWIGQYSSATEIVYYPHKYKLQGSGAPVSEYSTVFRLAEQFLIRAEARAQLGNLSGAISDLDIIRKRAGLILIQDSNPAISKEDLLFAIEHERQVEMFTEWGNRWFDLKRTGRAETVLSTTKTGFTEEDKLYPIPQNEFDRNPNLGKQNDGY